MKISFFLIFALFFQQFDAQFPKISERNFLFLDNTINRVSITSSGLESNGASSQPSLSEDGSKVVFMSTASNLVSNDTNAFGDVFLHNNITGDTKCISMNEIGEIGNAESWDPSISADGNKIVFNSHSSNLITGVSGANIYLYDDISEEISLISKSSAGVTSNNTSTDPTISGNGQYVSFTGYGNNLIENDLNGFPDVFIHNISTGETRIVNLTNSGDQTNSYTYNDAISFDGRFVLFTSNATNLVEDQTNGSYKVFIRDTTLNTTSLVSLAPDGTIMNDSYGFSISGDGRYVVFYSYPDVYARDTATGQTKPVSITPDGELGNAVSFDGQISSDGRFIAFRSDASNLVVNDTNALTDVFLRDMLTENTIMVSKNGLGAPGNDSSRGWNTSDFLSISSQGRYIAFSSFADNLLLPELDKNENPDIFVYSRLENASLTGVISDDKETRIEGVTVSINDHFSVQTDVNGAYQFGDLSAGSYTITPQKDGYRFAPEEMVVNFPVQTTQNFIIRPEIPNAFLDLPFDYEVWPGFTREQTFAILSGGNSDTTGKNGRVNSWFDHDKPNYSKNLNLRRWDGWLFDFNNIISAQGVSWYDGHSGIDFRMAEGQNVFSADEGDVVFADWGCMGNTVVLDHNNGYFSIYGHLRDKPTISGHVSQRDIIGKSGNTFDERLGCKSDGPHLHFGLYYDLDGDKIWESEEAVDPYGWNPSLANVNMVDPWSVNSFYLWEYSNQLQCINPPTGGSCLSPSGLLEINIPPDAAPGDTHLTISDVPSIFSFIPSFRTLGSNFLLEVTESTINNEISTGVKDPIHLNSYTFDLPITLKAKFLNSNLHIDQSEISLFRLDDSTNLWVKLPSSVDFGNIQVTSQTVDSGRFSIQAPLKCTADGLEPNDGYDGSSKIQPNGETISNLFDIAVDEDWFRFQTIKGAKYKINSSSLTSGVDTIIHLYDSDGVTELDFNDNNGAGLDSELSWSAPSSDTYFIRVTKGENSSFGCNAFYEINLTEEVYVYLPLVIK